MKIKHIYSLIFAFRPIGLVKTLCFLGIIGLFSCARPVANFNYIQNDTTVPAKIQFINTSEKADSIEWDFGDGVIGMDSLTNHRYILSGRYKVKLTAKKGKKESTIMKEIVLDPPKDCLVEIETEYGTMLAKLYDETPKHRDNFIKLAGEGFYNDLIFHRVVSGFMIQGGDPNSKNAVKGKSLGTGGPGYQIDAEFNNAYIHKKGALAAARMGDPVNPEQRSSGSQFYIVQGKPVEEHTLRSMELRKGINYSDDIKKTYQEVGGTPFLDYDYTVFGEVLEGLDVIDKIAEQKTNRSDRPEEDIKMTIRVIK